MHRAAHATSSVASHTCSKQPVCHLSRSSSCRQRCYTTTAADAACCPPPQQQRAVADAVASSSGLPSEAAGHEHSSSVVVAVVQPPPATAIAAAQHERANPRIRAGSATSSSSTHASAYLTQQQHQQGCWHLLDDVRLPPQPQPHPGSLAVLHQTRDAGSSQAIEQSSTGTAGAQNNQQHHHHTQQEQQQQAAAAAADASFQAYQQSITRSLRAAQCSSVAQLADIVTQHGPSMDGQSLTASFVAAARLGRDKQQQQQREQVVQLLEQQLLPLLQAKMRLVDAAGLQMVLHALATLHYRQEVTVLQLEVALTPIMHHLAPGRLCQLVWAVGQLGFRPQGEFVRQALRCSSRCMSVLHGQDLCQLLQGLVRLRLQLPHLWLDACCVRVLQLCAHRQLETRALCTILHSLARLVAGQQQQQRVPVEADAEAEQGSALPRQALLPQPLLQQLLDATQRVLLEAAAAGAAQQQQEPLQMHQQHRDLLLQSPEKQQQYQLQLQLPASLVASVIQQQQQQQQQQQWLWPSQARWQQQQQQQDQQQQQLQGGRSLLSPAGLNMLTDALRLLKTDPPRDWQAAYRAAAQQLMAAGDARNLPLMLAPLVRWRHTPSQQWLQQYLAACEGLLGAMQPQGLAVLGHSLASLRVQPPPAWLAGFLAAADTQRLAATPAGCSYLMHTLGRWRQLGCLPAAASDAEAGAAAAAKADTIQQQLQAAAHALVAQCLQCFMDEGQAFTPEQLGMFCKGLAMCGVRARPQLASALQQAMLQHVGHQSRRQGRRHRITAATLCSVLLALAVACPVAASPDLLSRLWSSWAAWLLPSTTPAQAAAAAWAAGRLGVQPPQALAQGLLQQVVVAAADAQLQHLADVLLEARQGGWQVQQQQVQALLGTMLQRQAAELSAAAAVAGVGHAGHDHDQQQHAWAPPSAQRLIAGCTCSSSSRAGIPLGFTAAAVPCLCGSSSSSSSSGEAAARLPHGMANHRLRNGWLAAAAAAAAWCDAMPLPQLQAAVRLYSRASSGLLLAELPSQQQQQQLQAHLQVMRAACSKRSGASLLAVAVAGSGGGGAGSQCASRRSGSTAAQRPALAGTAA